MASKSNIENAKSNLNALKKNHATDQINETIINTIRTLFDDIESIRKSKVKVEYIYESIKDDIGNISYNVFTATLSKIRKEKGIQLRNRSNNNKIKSAIKPIIKSVHNQNEIKQPTVANNGKLLDVTLSPLQRNDIDKSHYTPDDWANEWELIMDIYKSNKDLKWKYQVLGGNINDVEHLTDSLKNIRVISDKTSNLFRQQHNEYKIRSRKR
ncbi:hypothetical protein [Photobacterium carnosum]|uniref:hypothetical protein n=1 Tax=Photobacterium carnosum TaxID=2023717 RepID=UPI001E296B74|nr:hypothetical protein [Photobacterium carnosum]MCD9538963.1 hypothetical protein [Photobacterium carnosum]MCF2163683.1 hypothetical protein [Photobacterium carnosum]MCF2307799.1 hypothetical protein [Photobacterium carnosum]